MNDAAATSKQFLTADQQAKAVRRAHRIIADSIGLEDPSHNPKPRGAVQFLQDAMSSVEGIEDGRRFTLMVIRSDDFEAIRGALKCVEFVRDQQRKKGPQQ